MITVPAISMAGPSSWAVVTGWNQNQQIVSALDHLWSQVRLKHNTSTVHLWIDVHQQFPHQNGVPPDPCKQIAREWDGVIIASQVFTHFDFTNAFETLLNQMADKQCKITFVGGSTNGDGSVNLNQVGPTGTP
jgi:hypothetical protein